MADAAETQIDGFLAKYDPPLALQMRDCRKRLQALFPQGHELVYDNYNALAIGYAPTARPSDVVVSIAGYPRWVTLFFLKGAKLADPDGLLAGTGSTVRSIRLGAPSDLERDDILSLIAAARLPYDAAFSVAPGLTTKIRSVSATQRPRRVVQKAT